MRLAMQTAGEGQRTALLIHGLHSSGAAWHRVSGDLQLRGYRVLTVDLTGHGASPRASGYSPDRWADDVVETIAPVQSAPLDLVIGHSLGGLVASLAAERLAAAGRTPRRLVYVDPAFGFPRGVVGAGAKVVFGLMPRPTRAMLAGVNPRWEAVDVDIEITSLRQWHRRTLRAFVDTRPLAPPTAIVAPSLVVLASRSFLVRPLLAAALVSSGMTVRALPGTGHTVFRDDHAAFMATVDDWLRGGD